jgi:cardiolipin synthase
MGITPYVLKVLNYAFVINIILAIVVVFFERRKPMTTLAWLLVLLFIPVAGFVLYIFLGQDLRKKRLFYLKEEEEREFYPLLQQQDECLDRDQLVFVNARVRQYRDMVHLYLNSNQALFSQDNSVQVFDDGNELFPTLLEAIRRAKKYIHMEYYIIRNDSLGREFLEALCCQARNGIEVKLLYDGMGCLRLPFNFFQPLLDAGGKVASFFPPFIPYINMRINYRNHRKICLIDGEEGYVGGFNLGNEYRGLSKKFGFWRDTHVCLRGSAVDALEVRFLLDWRFASGSHSVHVRTYFPRREPAGETAVQIVSSGPDGQWSSIKDGY